MRDVAVAAANVQHFGFFRNYARNFQGHVVCAADFTPPAFAREAAFDAVKPCGTDFSL